MWRDELQAWLLARDSLSIPNLIFNMRYEGHPPLWHLLLFILTRFTTCPLFMQMLHLLIATLSGWVFIRFSPFSKIQKILFIFGYFPFYEYLIKSRSYVLGVLFIFIFCALFKSRVKRYILLFVVLFLLSQTTFIGAIVAVSMGLFLFLEMIPAKPPALTPAKKPDITVGTLIFVSMVILLFFQVHLPKDVYYNWTPGYFLKIDFRRIINVFSYINSTYLFSFYGPRMRVTPPRTADFIISLVELIFAALLFCRKPKVLFLYLTGTFGLLLFFYIKDGHRLRHEGYLYILLIACFWLAYYAKPRVLKQAFLNKISLAVEKYRDTFIIVFLSSHFIFGMFFTLSDWKDKFSGSKEAALFIKRNHLEEALILGDYDFRVSPIAAYLNTKIYYPSIRRFGSYCLWNTEKNRKPSQSEVIKTAKQLMLQRRKPVLLILTYELYPSNMTDGIRLLRKFTADIPDTKETYYLYFLAYDEQTGGSGSLPIK